MKILADLHTHSNYSRLFHGKNSIEEMVIRANEIGLQEIAITDHGFKHLFGTNKSKLKKAREEIDEINKWSKTKVLLGIEADLIGSDGTIDVDNETLSMLDILIVGYHRMISTDFAGYFGGQEKTKAAKEKATQAFINAIKRYPITIISHLDSVLTTDLYEIGKACKEKGVLVEINNRHVDWNEDQINDLIASDCMFVISSDAHSRDQVGEVSRAMNYITKYNIPSENVANVEFEPHEMTEADKEASIYYNIITQKQKQKEDYKIAKEVKRRTEFTNQLSDEMEAELAKIAKEKGIDYNSYQEEEEPTSFETIDTFMDSDLYDQVEKYLDKLKEEGKLDKNISAESFENFSRTGKLVEDKPTMSKDEVYKNLEELSKWREEQSAAQTPSVDESSDEESVAEENSTTIANEKIGNGALFDGEKSVLDLDKRSEANNQSSEDEQYDESLATESGEESAKTAADEPANRSINKPQSLEENPEIINKLNEISQSQQDAAGMRKGAVIARNNIAAKPEKKVEEQAPQMREDDPSTYISFGVNRSLAGEKPIESEPQEIIEEEVPAEKTKLTKSGSKNFLNVSSLVDENPATQNEEES